MAIYNTRPLQSGVCVEMTLTAVYCGSGGVFVRSVTLSDQILELVVEVVEAIRAVEKSWLLKVLSPPWSSLLPSSILHIMFDPHIPTSVEDMTAIINKDITVVAGEDSFSILSNPASVPVGKRIALDVFARTRETFLGM